jgi:hypothetical protein
MKRARGSHPAKVVPQSVRPTVRPTLELLEDRTLPAAFVPNELLVQYRPGLDALSMSLVRNIAHATVVEQIQTAAMKRSGEGILERWALPKVLNVNQAISLLRNNPVVKYAEPNWIYHTEVDSNDTYYTNGQLWGMYSDDLPTPAGPAGTTNQYGSWAEKAWQAGYTGSSSVYIGVIDEGIQYTHPDLAANVWTNPYDPVDGIDNDGNGRIDDVHGWDFFNNDNSTYDGTEDDHGTHVAGTIGGIGGNGQGVAGVNWNVTMISTKFLGPSGGTTAGAIQAVDYLTDLKTRHGLNIVASSNSWGGGGFSNGLLAAITRGAQAGILFIAAAGNANSNNDTTPSYPSNYNTTAGAGYDAVIAVASITNTGARSSFSSYGATTVDLGAPGSGIISTVPVGTYGNYSGTSMATPHVSGAAALYASRYPGATAQDIRNALLNGATPTSSLSGITVTGGRLNVWNTLGIAPAMPQISINDVSVTEGNSGNVAATFTVTLSRTSTQLVKVNYDTQDGTATAGSGDYISASGIVSFNPGETSKTITVLVKGDTTPEANENFAVKLSGALNANISDDTGVATIVDDDTPPDLSINDISVTEGNSGTSAATFTITLSQASTQIVKVNYDTQDGTATAGGGDYIADSGIVTFNPGETSKTVTVSVIGDTVTEGNENFSVLLSGAFNANIADDTGVATIVDDDFPVDVSINDVSVTEGNSGTTFATFTVSLSRPSTQLVKVNFDTSDGTATVVDNDYVPTSGTLTFNPGETNKTITVAVKGDTNIEPTETFTVRLSNLVNANFLDNVGVGTIVDDDLPVVVINIGDVTQQEGNTRNTIFSFTVTLSAPSTQIVRVDYATADDTATVANNDYVATTGTVRFSPGETSKTIDITVNADSTLEPDETFFVNLFNPVNASTGRKIGTGTIVNDDAGALPTLTINDVTVTEGNSGVTLAVFTVSLNTPQTSNVTVQYATADGTATVFGNDYTATSGMLVIAAGSTSATFTVQVKGDRVIEPDEFFTVNLFNAFGASILDFQGIGTIRNDD